MADLSEDKDMPQEKATKHEWHKIHDFFHGWGMREHIPDNDIVLEEHEPKDGEEWFIPWRVVRSKQQQKSIWLRDANHFLKIKSEDFFGLSSEALYKLYEELQPHLDAELERRRKLPPWKCPEKLYLPKINKVYPKLLA